MLIVKKGTSRWICYPYSLEEFDALVKLCRQKLGRSHWSVFVRTWSVRQIMPEELYLNSYNRVIELRHRDTALLVQLTWG